MASKAWRRNLRQFLRRDDASAEVEYMLILGLVVLPLIATIPVFIIKTNQDLYEKISLWVNLPFP